MISAFTVHRESGSQYGIKLEALITIEIIYGKGRALPFKESATADEIQPLPARQMVVKHTTS